MYTKVYSSRSSKNFYNKQSFSWDKYDVEIVSFDKKERLHRVAGPSYLNFNLKEKKIIIEEWSRHGIFHREGGPAVTNDRGRWWYKMGLLHRLDGPAIEWSDGDKEWWVEGVSCKEEEFFLKLPKDLQIKYIFNLGEKPEDSNESRQR